MITDAEHKQYNSINEREKRRRLAEQEKQRRNNAYKKQIRLEEAMSDVRQSDKCACPYCKGSGMVAQTQIPREIIDAIYRATMIDERLLMSKRRHQLIVHARMIVAHELRFNYKWSLVALSKAFGYHHATLIYYEAKHTDYMKYDPVYLEKYGKFISELGNAKHVFSTLITSTQ